MQLFSEEFSKGGRGRDFNQRKAIKHKQDMKYAEAYAKDLSRDLEMKFQRKYLPKTGKHRPPDKKQSKSSKVSGKELLNGRCATESKFNSPARKRRLKT